MMKFVYTISFLIAMLFSCNIKHKQNSTLQTAKTNSNVNQLSEQTGIEIFAIKLLENETKAQPEHLKSYFISTSFPNDPNRGLQNIPNEKVVLIPGVCFNIDSKQIGVSIMNKLRPKIEQKGYKLFISDGNYINDKGKIAIVRCDDEFTPLVFMQTNGINYEIDNHKLISYLDSLDQSLNLKLIGADIDWCEFEIRKEPQDWHQLAEKLYQICPDIVEEGTGNIEKLEAELRETKRLYFGFD